MVNRNLRDRRQKKQNEGKNASWSAALKHFWPSRYSCGGLVLLVLLVPSGFLYLNLRHFPKFTAFFGPNHRDLLVSPSVSTLATIAPCFAPRFSLHGAAILKTSLYDDDEQQHFPRDTTLSPFQDSLAAALQHDDRVAGSPRSVCTTA